MTTTASLGQRMGAATVMLAGTAVLTAWLLPRSEALCLVLGCLVCEFLGQALRKRSQAFQMILWFAAMLLPSMVVYLWPPLSGNLILALALVMTVQPIRNATSADVVRLTSLGVAASAVPAIMLRDPTLVALPLIGFFLGWMPVVAGPVWLATRRLAPFKVNFVRFSALWLSLGFPLLVLAYFVYMGVVIVTGGGAFTGLSNSMSPYSISSLLNNNAPAFTVKFQHPPLDKYLYWRGPVLYSFDGKTWKQPDWVTNYKPGSMTVSPEQYLSVRPVSGEDPLSYKITHWYRGSGLVLLDYPVQQKGLVLYQDLSPLQIPPTAFNNTEVKVGATVYPLAKVVWKRPLDPKLKAIATALPAGVAPEAVSMGKRLRQRFGTGPAANRNIANWLMFYFHRNFKYSLSPPHAWWSSSDPVDRFIFQTREGFCAQFASSMAVILRAADVPTRIVTGYLGVHYDPDKNQYMVEDSNAHAWIEAWLPGQGWTRFDPTSVVMPVATLDNYSAGVSWFTKLLGFRWHFGQSSETGGYNTGSAGPEALLSVVKLIAVVFAVMATLALLGILLWLLLRPLEVWTILDAALAKAGIQRAQQQSPLEVAGSLKGERYADLRQALTNLDAGLYAGTKLSRFQIRHLLRAVKVEIRSLAKREPH